MTITAKSVGIADIDGGADRAERLPCAARLADRGARAALPAGATERGRAAGRHRLQARPEARRAIHARQHLSISISYAGFKGIDVPSLLQSLWLYPFGCTEQLSSTAFPLLYYHQASLLGSAGLEDDDFQDTSDAGVHARVQQAIDTMLDRQGDNGVFGLWSLGDGEASALAQRLCAGFPDPRQGGGL